MRQYDYREKWKKLLTPEIVSYIAQIHEFKGEQKLFVEAKTDALTQLWEIAKIQSTEASNKIEGIYTSDERLRALVNEKTRPQTRNEKEIAGYRDVLNTIHDSHDHIPVKPSIILQLHRDMYKFEGYDYGGKYKIADNVIEEENEHGEKRVRFKPVPAWETAEAMERLCEAFDIAMATQQIDPIILIPMFVLDFLCIHPFKDGNGRMSRLLTLLILSNNIRRNCPMMYWTILPRDIMRISSGRPRVLFSWGCIISWRNFGKRANVLWTVRLLFLSVSLCRDR